MTVLRDNHQVCLHLFEEGRDCEKDLRQLTTFFFGDAAQAEPIILTRTGPDPVHIPNPDPRPNTTHFHESLNFVPSAPCAAGPVEAFHPVHNNSITNAGVDRARVKFKDRARAKASGH